MFKKIGSKIENYFSGRQNTLPKEQWKHGFYKSIDKNLELLRGVCNNSADLVIREMNVCGRRCAVIHIEGMINKQDLALSTVDPLTHSDIPLNTPPQMAFDYLRDNVFYAADQMETTVLEDATELLMSGFAGFMLDGTEKVLIIGVHGFQYRSIGEPSAETVQNGSREGFVEVIRINMTMVRRRMKSPDLVFEFMTVGKQSHTSICLCYMQGKVSERILTDIKNKLNNIEINSVLGAEYLSDFLENKPFGFFSSVGTTERPDVMCGKISEGRIGILVDGTPDALILPYLFTENFQTADDYTVKPFYAAFSRWLRYISFFISVYLPAIYVSVCVMHNELLPVSLLYSIVDAESGTPFNITGEVFVLHIVFELIREAGLRMPRTINSAVSFIATLLIGEAAVSAGLISLPVVMIVAITGVCSFTTPSLYQTTAILRLILIPIGGYTGVLGISAFSAALAVGLCALNPEGVPFTAPISPFRMKSMRDIAVRAGWKTLSGKTVDISKMPGSEEE